MDFKSSRPSRKNTGIILLAVAYLYKQGVRSGDSQDIAEFLEDRGLDKLWNRNPNRKDDHGMKKTVADAIGGNFGLLPLRADGKWDFLPDTLSAERLNTDRDVDYLPIHADAAVAAAHLGVNVQNYL